MRKLQVGISLLSLALMLLASIGIPLSEHWCGGKVASLRLYGKAHSCAMMSEPVHSGVSIGSPGSDCCRDELTLQSASGLDNDGASQSWQAPPLTASLAILSAAQPAIDARAYDLAKVPYPLGPPPGQSPDILALYQAYLI